MTPSKDKAFFVSGTPENLKTLALALAEQGFKNGSAGMHHFIAWAVDYGASNTTNMAMEVHLWEMTVFGRFRSRSSCDYTVGELMEALALGYNDS